MLAATWFVAYSAVLPLTQLAWGMSARDAGIVQAAFHLGYLTSLFIVGFIADHFGAKRAYITTGIAACLSPWAFVLFADGFWSAVWLHAFTGLCQGGTYTPALALINDHVERARRGRAMGYLIAGSSAGYAICLGVAGARAQLHRLARRAGCGGGFTRRVVGDRRIGFERDPEHDPSPARRRIASRLAARGLAQPPRHAFHLGLHLP